MFREFFTKYYVNFFDSFYRNQNLKIVIKCFVSRYVYRLCGPRLWPDARAAILDVQRRVVSGMRGMKLVACRRCNKFADCSIMETTTTGNGKSIGLGLEHSDLVPLETAVVQMESSPCCHSCSKQIKGLFFKRIQLHFLIYLSLLST